MGNKKTVKDEKGRSEGKLKIRKDEVIRFDNEIIKASNQYSALTTDDIIQEIESGMSIWENSSRIATSSPRINTRFNKQERINTIGSQDKSPKREGSRPNLQHKNITPRQHNT